MPVIKSGPNKDPGRPSNQKNGKPTLDDILGRAKNTLDQSRQFRDAKVDRSRPVRSAGLAPVSSTSTKYGSKILPMDVGLGSNIQLRRPGTTLLPLPRSKRTNYERSNSDSTYRGEFSSSSAQRRHTSPSGSSSSSANDSDSTLTPPTITDTPVSSKSRSQRRVTYDDQDGTPLPERVPDISGMNIPYPTPKGKNLLERTLLVRGDPVSNESYAVLKAMMFDKEHSDVERSYTEDFASDVLTTAKSDSIEVPGTETDTNGTEIPMEESLSSVTMKDTRSSLLVDEIMDNLQDLDVSDQLEPNYDEEGNPIPSMEEQIALADVEAIITRSSSRGSEKLMSIHNSQVSSSIVPSKRISNTSRSSKLNTSVVTADANGNNKIVKEQGSFSTSSKASVAVSKASSNRISSRKNFQGVLSKVKLDKVEENLAEYVPPVTKPQRQIQYILEKEIYQKELKRIRSMQKREETQQKKVHETKTQNLAAVREAQESGVKFSEPSFTKLLLPELIHNPFAGAVSRNPSNNLGAPYFNRDGSLGMDYAIENYPRTPDENFVTQSQKMDIPQLVREVLASNERMYKMTVDASHQMGVQYGKNAKLLLKTKNKELQKKQNTRK